MRDTKWNDDCLLGIPAIDLQHKRIFDCFATMAAEALNRHDRFLADSSYARLIELLEQHFALEESMMRSFDYPELERHKEEHRQIHADLEAAARNFFGVNGAEPQGLVRVFKKWRNEHIMTSDRQYLQHFAGPLRADARSRAGAT